ncbi:hypothetical protein BKA57DRAFT_132983 [Linnemannia elongata]|nr:hypothetical protein BKA57DRAFT_132983 [Linnemannia elongata]
MASLATKLASASLNRSFVTLPATASGLRTVLNRSALYPSDDHHGHHGHHESPATPSIPALKTTSLNNNRSFVTGMFPLPSHFNILSLYPEPTRSLFLKSETGSTTGPTKAPPKKSNAKRAKTRKIRDFRFGFPSCPAGSTLLHRNGDSST